MIKRIIRIIIILALILGVWFGIKWACAPTGFDGIIILKNSEQIEIKNSTILMDDKNLTIKNGKAEKRISIDKIRSMFLERP